MHVEVPAGDLVQGNWHGGVPVLTTSSGLVVTGTLPAAPFTGDGSTHPDGKSDGFSWPERNGTSFYVLGTRQAARETAVNGRIPVLSWRGGVEEKEIPYQQNERVSSNLTQRWVL